MGGAATQPAKALQHHKGNKTQSVVCSTLPGKALLHHTAGKSRPGSFKERFRADVRWRVIAFLLAVASAMLLHNITGPHTAEVNPSGFHYELVNGTRYGPSRRGKFAERIDSLLTAVFALGLIPSHYKTANIADFRAAIGIPREADPYEDADVFDDFIDRTGLKCVRDGGYRGEPLTPLGRFATLQGVGALVDMRRRLLPENLLPSTVAALEQPVERRKIYIISMPRSGTTIMQRLLAADPSNRAFTLSNLRDPVDNGDKAEAWRQLQVGKLVAPHVLSIHPMEMDFPEEETFLMNAQLPILGTMPIAGVQEFINELYGVADGPMAPVYRTLNRWLELMAATYATPEQDTLIFKSPFHMLFVDDLVASLEGEGPVVLIRNKRDDLVKVMTSLLSLMRAQQEIFFGRVDLDYIEQQMILPTVGLSFPEMIVRQYKRMNVINATTHHTVIDVDFEDIIRNPVGVMEAVYARVPGMAFGPELGESVLAAFQGSKEASDSYRGYHGFPLKPSSIAHIRECEKEIASLLHPIPVA